MPGRRRHRPRRRVWIWLLLVVLAVLAGLAWLARPFLDVSADANAAKADLESARTYLSEGKPKKAVAAVKSARTNSDEVQEAVQGFGGDVWSWVPLAGGPVRDVRRLGNALDDMVTVAEAGVELLPQVRGREATLYDNGSVDLDTLEVVTAEVARASERLDEARAELEEIADGRLAVGDMLSEQRDAALDQVVPLSEGADTLAPVLDVLPDVLGGAGKQTYVLALLNPSETRYSGGTPLAYATLEFTDGEMFMDRPKDVETTPEIAQPIRWPRVEGNTIRRPRQRLHVATAAPDWAVSGEELTRGWKKAFGQEIDGVLAVDVVALSRLAALTGPIDMPGMGRIMPNEMTETLVGSYDDWPDDNERRLANRALVMTFASRLFAGDPVDTMRVLGEAAKGRHFAAYFTDDEAQSVFSDLGVTGELGSSEHDYIGVFSQNTDGTKADYWQKRSITSHVRVKEDGSARVRLEVRIHNDSPPYVQPGIDPGTGYYTRYNHLSLATFLPPRVIMSGVTLDGEALAPKITPFFDHLYFRHEFSFDPQQERTMVVEYDVLDAAEVDSDGTMHYRLAFDPQGLVHPQALHVQVEFPEGMEVTEVPQDWQTKGARTALFDSPGLDSSASFEVTARP